MVWIDALTKNNELSILDQKKRLLHVESDLSSSMFRCCYIKFIYVVFFNHLKFFYSFCFPQVFNGVTYDEGRTIIYLLRKPNMQTVAWDTNQIDLQIDRTCFQVLKHLSRFLHLLNPFCFIFINTITIAYYTNLKLSAGQSRSWFSNSLNGQFLFTPLPSLSQQIIELFGYHKSKKQKELN